MAHPCHICTGTDWAHPHHICTGTGLTPATSAPGPRGRIVRREAQLPPKSAAGMLRTAWRPRACRACHALCNTPRTCCCAPTPLQRRCCDELYARTSPRTALGVRAVHHAVGALDGRVEAAGVQTGECATITSLVLSRYLGCCRLRFSNPCSPSTSPLACSLSGGFHPVFAPEFSLPLSPLRPTVQMEMPDWRMELIICNCPMICFQGLRYVWPGLLIAKANPARLMLASRRCSAHRVVD